MTDAKLNDCASPMSVIAYSVAYKLTLYKYSDKTQIEMDTILGEKGDLKDLVKMAVKNGKSWQKVTWSKDESTGKLKKNVVDVLDHPENA